MKVDMLFDAIGRLDDAYIVSAQNRLPCDLGKDNRQGASGKNRRQDAVGKNRRQDASGKGRRQDAVGNDRTHSRGIYRRIGLTAAALFLFLISSFTVAMAATEDFRNAVFRFFHISTPVQVPPIEEEAGQQDQITFLDSMTVEDTFDIEGTADGKDTIHGENPVHGKNTVHAEYLRAKGSFGHTVSDGVIYVNNVEAGRVISAYAIEDGQISLLEARTEAFEYTWDGIPYSISFDWYEKDGGISAIGHEYDLDTSAEWSVRAIHGSSQYVELRLSHGAQIDYSSYPLLYDLKTHKVMDVLEKCEEIKSQNILEAKFSPDLTKVLLTCGENVMWYDEHSSTVYCYDIAKNNLRPLSELCEMNVMDAWFMDDDAVGCLWYDESFHYTLRTLVLSTEEYFEVFCHMPKLNRASDSSGISFADGRYGLLIQENGSSYVYDFKTGEKALVEGFQYTDGCSLADFNQDGTKLLLYRLDSGENIWAVWIGILDLEKKSLTGFERKGSEAPKEYAVGWFDNEKVGIQAHTDEYWYLSLYEISN